MMSGPLTERLRVATGLLAGLPPVLAEKGLDFAQIARAAGLDPVAAVSEDAFVGLAEFARLLELAAVATDDDCFGLRLADRVSGELSGALTYAMRNAPTLRDALLTLIRYIRTRIDVTGFQLTVEDNQATVEWTFSPLIVHRAQLCDFSAVLLVRYVGWIVGPNWRPTSATIERPPPRSQDAHRRLFGRRIAFVQQGNSIAFPADLLSLPIEGADPVVHKIARQLLDRQLAERGEATDLITCAREEIVWSLPSEEGIQIDRLARRLGVSTRTLQRKLADAGTSFQELVDDTRRMLARRYLEDRNLRLSEIAYRLGFSAPSAFTRASYRWFGKNPAEVRRKLTTDRRDDD
ncbi:AraC family transcriptional regulator [Tepidamorphus gemmatus]|uniref:AraC family transcriptional regulator n=2 Tax=Tepidamorphus gemmatus TaxID=747076 RepID=A0A4R3MIL1_9HYPH|nr:AraC family transcriptional regulator [Tepidamorphus gemmatus]